MVDNKKDETTATAAPADKEEVIIASSLKSLQISNFLTPITTQSYLPVIPLLLTEDLDEPIKRVGQVFFVLAFGSFFSFVLMKPLLGTIKTKYILMNNFFVRSIAGLIWVYAVWRASEYGPGGTTGAVPGPSGTVPLIIGSRFLYGLTLNSFAISQPWIGTKMDNDAKPTALAQSQAMVGLGIMVGPVVGIGVAALASTSMGGYLYIGWFTVILSIFQLLVTSRLFLDDTVLAPGGEEKPDEVRDRRNAALTANEYYETAKFVGALSIVQMFLSMAAFFSGFESTLTLQVKTAYGWTLGESMYAWGPMAFFGLFFGAVVVPKLIDTCNWARVATFGLAWGWGSILGINWFNLLEPIPAWWFVIEGVFGMGGTCVASLLGTIISQRLPSSDQINIAAGSAIAGQLGRAVGPVAATWIFQTAEEMTDWSRGAGANFSRMYVIAVGSIPISITLICNFTRIFGSFRDLSPKDRRALQSNDALI